MRGIEVPERTEDFTADPVELFFDLGFVLAFSQLVGHLVHHPDWVGVGEAALLFWLLWMPWSQFTWSANLVSGNGRLVRLLFLVGTVVSIPMAASVSTAFDDGGPVFAISLAVIYALALGTMAIGVEHGSATHEAMRRLALSTSLAVAVLVMGSFVDDGGRVAIWLASTGIILVALVRAGSGEWVVRTGHFAERHGLILIIALGEVIVAIGTPVVETLESGAGLPSTTVVALMGAGVFAVLLWWSYFDRPGPALEHRAEGVEEGVLRGRFARDVYTSAHALIVVGVIVAAAGLEEIALHPDDSVPTAFRAMLGGGLALVMAGVAVAVWRAFRAVAWERVVAVGTIAAVLLAGRSVDGPLLIVAVDAVLLVALVVEHIRVEQPFARQRDRAPQGHS